jgi:thiol-disulfide isomerase/thioredoxin
LIPDMKKTVFLSFCFIVLLAGCSRSGDSADDSGLETMTAPPVKASFERPLPDFAKITSEGDSLISGSLHGKVTLVNFWATWCGPCVIETPELVALQEEWEDRDFQIVGVSMDEEGFDAVGPFADDFKIQYPLVLDDGALADEFGGVYALPTTFVVDSEGMILHRFIGIFPFEEMRPELEKLLAATGSP